LRQAYDYRQDQPGFYRAGRAGPPWERGREVISLSLSWGGVRAPYWAADAPFRPHGGGGRGRANSPTSRSRVLISSVVTLSVCKRPFDRRGSSSENTREEAGRPDAIAAHSLLGEEGGGVSARARGGRALPEASLESVLGGEGRGAQPDTTTHLLSRGRALGVDSPHARGLRCRVVGPALPSALCRELYLGRTGFCEWVGVGPMRARARTAQRVSMQTSARALG